MTKPVVVGVDGSEASERALLWAAEFSAAAGARLVVALARTHPAQVMSLAPGPVWPWPIVGSSDPQELEETVRLLTDAVNATLPQDQTAEIDVVVRDGSSAQALMDVATELDAELLVVGRRGLGGFKRLLLGSVSDECARYASCPVAVIGKPDHAGEANPVVAVGVDGSPASVAAVDWAARVAQRRGHELLLLHAYESPTAPPGSLAAALPQLDGSRQVQQESAAELLAAEVARVRQDHSALSVTGELLAGYPSEMLATAVSARHVYLFVLGSRGMGGFASMLLGSVADQCLHHVNRPMVVYRQTSQN